MATNNFVIDPELLYQAKTFARAAAEENREWAARLGTLTEELRDAVNGMNDALADGIQNNRITQQADNFTRRQKSLVENAERAERLSEMIDVALNQGEITERGLLGVLESVRDFFVDMVDRIVALGGTEPSIDKQGALASAALGSAFGLVVPGFYTSVKPIFEQMDKTIQEVFQKAQGQAQEQTPAPAPAANPNLTSYSNSSCNWSPKAGGKANDYSNYTVVAGFDERFVLDQHNYYNAKNACTATSDAIVASITTGELHTPTKSYWTGSKCKWPNTAVIAGTQNITLEKQCQIICENLEKGNPVIMRVPNHSVVAVGIRQGVDAANAKPADILVIDPGDGRVKTADEIYSGWYQGSGKLSMQDNIGWSLRVAKSSAK